MMAGPARATTRSPPRARTGAGSWMTTRRTETRSRTGATGKKRLPSSASMGNSTRRNSPESDLPLPRPTLVALLRFRDPQVAVLAHFGVGVRRLVVEIKIPLTLSPVSSIDRPEHVLPDEGDVLLGRGALADERARRLERVAHWFECETVGFVDLLSLGVKFDAGYVCPSRLEVHGFSRSVAVEP